MSMVVIALATRGTTGTARSSGAAPHTRSTTARMWPGVVPQQPPTTDTPKLSTNSACASARASGERS